MKNIHIILFNFFLLFHTILLLPSTKKQETKKPESILNRNNMKNSNFDFLYYIQQSIDNAINAHNQKNDQLKRLEEDQAMQEYVMVEKPGPYREGCF